MILLWPEGKLLARIVFISTFSPIYSESCELSLRFLCSGHCLEQFINKIIADLRGFGLKGSGLARFYCTNVQLD